MADVTGKSLHTRLNDFLLAAKSYKKRLECGCIVDTLYVTGTLQRIERNRILQVLRASCLRSE